MDFDIIIIGAGPAGLSFACSLRDTQLKVLIIEQQSKSHIENPSIDGRDIALTHLSRQLMKQAGIWQRIDPDKVSPIQQAQVINGESSYQLTFDAKGDKALGFLVSNHLIRKAIYEEFDTLNNVTLMTDSQVKQVSTHHEQACIELSSGERISAKLLVAADTRFSNSRRQMGISTDSHDFGRTAIVCWMAHEKSHQNTAFECFHYGRTLAVLPMPNNISSIVITVPSEQADSIVSMDEEDFNQDIQRRLNNKLGKMTLQGQRHRYPLVGVHANQFYKQRFALIGDAAVGMHPVTAHGFNLGLSGQDLLAKEIISRAKKGLDISDIAGLAHYHRQHVLTTRPLYHGTNTIVGLFTNDKLPAKILRTLALKLSNNIPPIKWAIQQKLMSKHQLTLPPFPPKPPNFLKYLNLP